VTLRRLTEGLAKTDIKALLNPDSELEQSLQALVPSSKAGKMVPIGTQTGDVVDDDERFRQEFSSFVETMKTKENVRMIMGQLKRLAPFLYEALVSERDAYMAAGLNGLNELTTIVAVVGIAHVDGIEANLSMNGWKQASPSCSQFRVAS
jgi:pheromone shutdown protein TraB